MKYTTKLRLRRAIILGIIACICCLLNVGYFYQQAKGNLKNEIQQYLTNLANTASNFTDGDKLKTIRSDADKENYQAIKNQYLKILDVIPDIAYIYAMIYRDGKVWFIIDSQSDKINQKDTASIMDVYTDASTTLLKAFKLQTLEVEDEPYKDKWGEFLSVYAPVRDSSGLFIGMIGVDIRNDEYALKFIELQKALLLSGVFCFITGFLVALIAYYFNRESINLN